MKSINLLELNDNPEYAEAKSKLDELKAELKRLQASSDEILSLINNAVNNPPNRLSVLTSKALVLLGGTDIPPNSSVIGMQEQYTALQDDIGVHTVAIRIQQEKTDVARSKASKAIIEQTLPTHRLMVREICKALFALEAALSVESNLRDDLSRRDIMSGELRPMPFYRLGTLKDPNSSISAYLLEAFENDFIELADLPENLLSWARAKKYKPQPSKPTLAIANPDGWLAA